MINKLEKKNKQFIIFFEVIFLVVLFTMLFEIYYYSNKLYEVSENRVKMLLAANRLKQSSDDLTNFSRAYVVTKNKKYKYQYFQTLNIRNGIAPRPLNYQFVYWNLKEEDREKKHPPTKNLSLETIFNSLPFSKKELELLKLSHKNSDKLAEFEKEAFNLIKTNQKKAIDLLFSKKYDDAKADIMNPIDDFTVELNNRMAMISKKIKTHMNHILKLFTILAIMFVIINIYIYFYLNNKNKEELKEKNKLIKNVNSLNETLEEKVRKRTLEIEKLLQVKSEFLANMSHEIRTPLNAMLGFIQILGAKDLDEESKKYLKIIETSGKDLVSIINDILDFSKIEAGKFNIEYIEFNPKEELLVLKELFSSKASEKNILLEMNENLQYTIVSDPTRIKQVIANLLSNAIKFTHNNKKIVLNINYNEKTEILYIEVIDEGIGIQKDKLKNIFEAFSQADTSTTRKYGGTGLGLTISYKLVELLGGELKVKSEIEKGSKFYFSIPAPKKSLIKDIQPKEKSNLVNKKFKGFILLVEDNKANQMFMKVILDKMKIKFDIANDGLEAIKKFKTNNYDLILMDENMPNMTGIEATKHIREYERTHHLTHTPIVALTANAMEGDKDRFILVGMDYYLSKPLDIKKLQNVLDKI